MNLEEPIDELYQLPLEEFTAARNALAKTLTGPEKEQAARVRALPKPTLVPWAVNQLFWSARPTYERLMKAGEALREAQIAALSGRALPQGRAFGPEDVKRASEAHRKALADAVGQATRLAAVQSRQPDADDLSRTLESLSLAAAPPEHPGRLTEIVRPAGFEAIAGVSPAAPLVRSAAPSHVGASSKVKPGAAEARRARAEAAAERKREMALAARRRQLEAGVNAAERELERAKSAEKKARAALQDAELERDTAAARLVEARKLLTSMSKF